MAEMQGGRSSVSNEWRKKGNELYLSATYDMDPVLRQDRLRKAIVCYTKAFEFNKNKDESSSAAKNLAMASWRLAELMPEKNSHVHQLKEAARYFGLAYSTGLSSSKAKSWSENLLTTTREFIDGTVGYSQCLDFHDRTRLLNEIADRISEGTLKAICFLQIAETLFKAGVSELEQGQYKECLKLMHESYMPVEEARRYGGQDAFIETEVRVVTEELYMYQCTSESMQARVTGDQLFEKVLLDEENLNVDLVWDVVDWYKTSILLTREKDVEYEAIGHSRLGRVFDKVLKLKAKAKQNFMRCLELVNSMRPRCFSSEKWYQECTQTLERYQKESVQNEESEWSKEKNIILLELKEEIEKLEEISEDAEKLIRYIYKVHPPKNINQKLNESLLSKGENRNVRQALRGALLHYHPDRLTASVLGKKWVVLCEEITKYLNRLYEVC